MGFSLHKTIYSFIYSFIRDSNYCVCHCIRIEEAFLFFRIVQVTRTKQGLNQANGRNQAVKSFRQFNINI